MTQKLAIVLAVLGGLAAGTAEARTWKDSTGKYTVEAEFVGVQGGQVQLRKPDGSVIAVPLERLSEADRRHVQSLSGTPPAAASSPTEAEPPGKKPGVAGQAAGRGSPQVKFGRAAIDRALSQRVNLPPGETTLVELEHQLGNQLQIAIELDARAFDDIGISTNVKVTVGDKGGTLEDVLNGTLEPLKLAWMICADMLVITSREEAEHSLEVGVYKILRPQAGGDLVKDLRTRIAPQSWSNVGGPGSCRAWAGNALVVSQTSAVHRQIAAQYPAVLRRILPEAAARKKGPLDAALISPVACEYVETPLDQVAADLSKQAGVAVTVDPQALTAIGVGLDCPVTFIKPGISLESALTWILRGLGLTWVPEQTGLQITTPDKAESVLSSATYDVRELLAASGGNAAPLVDLITATIAPQAWHSVGGPGKITPAATGLQIQQIYEIQRLVEQLLADLRQTLRG